MMSSASPSLYLSAQRGRGGREGGKEKEEGTEKRGGGYRKEVGGRAKKEEEEEAESDHKIYLLKLCPSIKQDTSISLMMSE